MFFYISNRINDNAHITHEIMFIEYSSETFFDDNFDTRANSNEIQAEGFDIKNPRYRFLISKKKKLFRAISRIDENGPR